MGAKHDLKRELGLKTKFGLILGEKNGGEEEEEGKEKKKKKKKKKEEEAKFKVWIFGFLYGFL